MNMDDRFRAVQGSDVPPDADARKVSNPLPWMMLPFLAGVAVIVAWRVR